MKEINSIIYDLLNDDFVLNKSQADIEKYTEFSHQKVNLLKRWVDSNYTDYGVYDDPDYQWDLVNCYLAISKQSVGKIVKYLSKNVSNYQELSLFDDYNGNGLTTLLFQDFGFKDVSYYNSVDFQVDTLNSICDKYGFNKPKLDKERKNTYDIYVGLECIEHFKKPSDYLNDIMPMVKSGGYLFITFNGFSWTPEKSIGHFWEYETETGEFVSGNKIRKLLYKQLKNNGFTKVDKACWNANPQLFIKN